MSNSLREQNFKSLNLKETDELLEIWKTNDRTEWSDTAFEVIEALLNERIGQIPSQNEPVFEHKDNIDEEDGLEEWEAKLLDEENQPEFYDTLEVLELRHKINNVAIAAIITYALVGIF